MIVEINNYFEVNTEEHDVSVDAKYKIEVIWGHRNQAGYRNIEHIDSIVIDNRDELVEKYGEENVFAEEERVLEEWLETAVQEEADEYGDYQYEMYRDGDLS